MNEMEILDRGIQAMNREVEAAMRKMAQPRFLLSAPPPVSAAPDRSKCKAWCGMEVSSIDGLRKLEALGYLIGDPNRLGNGHPGRWCSPACRDTRVPPLPATPVTTGAKPTTLTDFAKDPNVLKRARQGRRATNDSGTAHLHSVLCFANGCAKAPAQEAPKAPGTSTGVGCVDCGGSDHNAAGCPGPMAPTGCCRISRVLAAQGRNCPTHWKAPTVDLSFMLTEWDLLPEAKPGHDDSIAGDVR